MSANRYAFYALIAAALLFGWLFFDQILSWILDNPLMSLIAGGGGATLAETARRKNKSVQEAEIYDDMRVGIDEEVVNELIEADRLADLNEDITDRKPEGDTKSFIDRARSGDY